MVFGGAIYCRDTSPVIQKCVLYNNTAEAEGGAVGCFGSDSNVLIKNTVFAGNNARYGGAVSALVEASAVLRNCTIAGNSAKYGGGGVHAYKGSLDIKNCLIRQNTLDFPEFGQGGPQIFLESSGSELNISYTNLKGGQAEIVGQTVYWLEGNIDTEPNFASFDPAGNPETWDFRLRSQFGRWNPNTKQYVTDSLSSPCIDAGDPDSEYNRQLWPHGKRVNMGAYGNTPQGSMSASTAGNISDLNNDGTVHPDDLDMLTGYWLTEATLRPEDLSRNGFVDLYDLAIFAHYWLWQEQ